MKFFQTKIIAISIVMFFLLISKVSFAQQLGASLYIAPLSENPRSGSNFSVAIKIDSLGQPINAGRGILTFNKDKLEILNISKIGSIFNLWVEEPNFSNLEGILKFQGGVPKPGFIGNGGTVLHIIFKAKSRGITSLVWKDGDVLASDGVGTNILINLQNLDFSIDEALSFQGRTSWQNVLIILNLIFMSVFVATGLFFLYKFLLKRHDAQHHHYKQHEEQEHFVEEKPEDLREDLEKIVHDALKKELKAKSNPQKEK